MFFVLFGAHMPSILVEVSFISNQKEEKRLKSSSYQESIARGIAMGIKQYLDQQDFSRLLANR